MYKCGKCLHESIQQCTVYCCIITGRVTCLLLRHVNFAAEYAMIQIEISNDYFPLSLQVQEYSLPLVVHQQALSPTMVLLVPHKLQVDVVCAFSVALAQHCRMSGNSLDWMELLSPVIISSLLATQIMVKLM